MLRRCYKGCPNRRPKQVMCIKCAEERLVRMVKKEMWLMDQMYREHLKREDDV